LKQLGEHDLLQVQTLALISFCDERLQGGLLLDGALKPSGEGLFLFTVS